MLKNVQEIICIFITLIQINNYILYPEMFFGNPQLLERNLHNDLNTLIKNVKARQDQYLTLLQYNKNLIANLSEIQHMSFFTDQVNKHKSFLSSSLAAHQKIVLEEEQIKQKYNCVISSENNIIKLMGRVTARVLEICQSSLEKVKFLDPTLNQKFSLLKATLLQNMNQNNKINIQSMLDTIINYIVGKDAKEIERLKQIIRILMTGDFEKVNDVYAPPPKSEARKIIQEKKQIFKSPSTQKAKQKSKDKEKEQDRLSRYEQIRLNNEKIKKKKNKVAKQLITNVYSTMDLAKQQFLDDFSFVNNPEEKKKRLYEEIFSRNKFNYDQIRQFQSKKSEFQQKIKQFKEMMEIQSKRIQQALVIVINKTQVEPKTHALIESPIKEFARKQTKSDIGQSDLGQIEDDSNSPDRLQRVFRRRERKNIRAQAQSPRFQKQAVFTLGTQEGFQHIKFDVKNEQVFTRSNRARLPQIPGRSSLDNRYQGRGINNLNNLNRMGVQKKDEKPRINIMKNVQIGTLNTSVVKNSFNQASLLKKSPRDKSNGAQTLFENVPTTNMNGSLLNGLDFTFYQRRKVSKFYETKNKFIL